MSYGATALEWAHFDLDLGLTEHLLPVVSNPNAKISPDSKMKGVGKTPSIYNRNRLVAGIPKWTEKRATGDEVARWSKEGDYGICIQTRAIRALDIDIDDPVLAGRIAQAFRAALAGSRLDDGVGLARRFRQGSGKCLLAFRVVGGPDGLPKRSFRVDGGLVEFLADGQQFVAAGTHTSGVRYEWEGGLPADFPIVEAEDFERAWNALVSEFAVSAPVGGVVRQRGATIEGKADPVADWLQDQGLILEEGRDGALYVECPWKHEHSSDSGITEAAWFPAGTNGYERGAFRCLHAHCDGRGAAEYEVAVGYSASDFEELEDEQGGYDFDGEDGASGGASAGDTRVVGGNSGGPQVFDRGDLTLIATATLRRVWRRGDDRTLIRTGGGWYEWTGTCYQERVEEEVRSDLWRYLSTVYTTDKKGNVVPLAPTKDYVGNVADALRSVAEARGAVAPIWLPGGSGPDPHQLVPLADGVLYVSTRALLPHDPKLFMLNALPYAWGDDPGQPREWLKFLDSLWGEDREAIDTLQEMFGYLLTPDTSQQKMFMLVGPRRSGKGTIGRVLSALIGAHNTCAPTMASFSGEFGLEPLIGKLVAIFPDARSGSLTMGAQAVVERLLMLSGEDTMSVNRKNKTFWTGRPSARVVVLTNEPPKLGDASGALPGRFVVLSMYRSFYGHEDHGLEARLLAELPAIFRWALDGRDRLKARGYFVQPESGVDDIDDMVAMGNPIGQFVEQCCDIGAGLVDSVEVLFEAWKDWCGASGHFAGAKETFGRSLRVAQPSVRKTRPRGEDGKQHAAYTGIRVREETRKNLLVGSDGL